MKMSAVAARMGQLFKHMPSLSPTVHGVALGAVTALAAWAPAAQAVVVVSPAANVVVPATTAGIYINVVSGAAGGSSTAGWDINPWGSGSLFIYAPSTGGGGLVTSANSVIASIAVGSTVGPATSFVTTGVASFGSLAGQWTLNATNYFGFNFIGDDTLVHYGYGSMIVGATALVRTVGQLWYESSANTAISAVPEPSSTALLLAGVAAGALVLRRKQAVLA